MIPLESRRRLIDVFPSAYQIRIDGQTYQRDLHYAWFDEDREPAHPGISMRLDPVGQVRDGMQPLGQFLRNLDVDDPEIAVNRLRGERLYDELSVRVATRGQIAGTTGSERAHVLAHQLSQFARFDLTDILVEPGSRNEISMTAAIVSGPDYITDLVDEIEDPTWQFTVRLHYTATRDVLVDALQDTEIEYRLVF